MILMKTSWLSMLPSVQSKNIGIASQTRYSLWMTRSLQRWPQYHLGQALLTTMWKWHRLIKHMVEISYYFQDNDYYNCTITFSTCGNTTCRLVSSLL
jgi:hypothetical protein